MSRLEFLGKLPDRSLDIAVAVSGGADSMAVLDFLIRGGRKVIAFHFNHGTEHGQEAEEFVAEYCKGNDILLNIGRIDKNSNRPKDKSTEEYWRDERYKFLDLFNIPIIMAHNLDDQVEQYLFSSLHGNSKLIPYQRNHVIRPFMLTRKESMISWCDRKNVPYLVDPGNFSPKYMRSYIRAEIMPRALVVNPGLYKVVKKKILGEFYANH